MNAPELISSTELGKLRAKLETDGVVLLKGVLASDFINTFRKEMHQFFAENSKRKGDLISDSEPDALGRFEFTRSILAQQSLFDLVSNILSFPLYYCHHSDIHINKTANWHRDSIKKPSYFDFCEHEIFDTHDYKIFKIGVYLQDHDKGDGLSVIPGSHLIDDEPVIQKAVDLDTKAGDVILFDTRIYHKGIFRLDEKVSNEDRMSFFMTLAANNYLTESFVSGTIWRQNRQIKREIYELPDTLKNALNDIFINIMPYSQSPQPSSANVLKQLDALKKENRMLKTENRKLQKSIDKLRLSKKGVGFIKRLLS